MKSAIWHDILKEIKTTFNRFIAIFAIVALGVGFFAGLKGTTPDMKQTADLYFDEQNLMDLRLLSTMGFTEDDIAALRSQPGVKAVMPTYSVDALIEGESGNQAAKIHALPADTNGDNPDYMNRPVLVEGRLPEKSGECVIDPSIPTGAVGGTADAGELGGIGSKIVLAVDNEPDTLDLLKTKEYTVVGTVQSPYYISFQRGNTNIGNGKISYYMMIPEEDFDSDYYLEAFVTVEGAARLLCYSDEYSGLIGDETDRLEDLAADREQDRYDEIVAEANGKVNEAQTELDAAQTELDEKQAEADKKLAEAEAELADGERQTGEAAREIADKERELSEGEDEYRENFAAFDAQVADGQAQIDAGRKELEAKKQEYDKGAAALEAGYGQLDGLRAQIGQLQAAGVPAEQIAALAAQADGMQRQLEAAKAQLDEAGRQIAAAEQQLLESQAQLDASKANGWTQLMTARQTLDDGWAQLAAGEEELADARIELEEGRVEYQDKKEEADAEIADAQNKLDDAQAEIDDAKEEIADLEPPKWYVLDRNTNPGYAGFGSDADKVDAVSTVFPVFFFLVAALVCLTTMTRMVEEQRTQIGVLKALGYGKGVIAAKYMVYAATASVLGSIAGLLVGFWIFPTVIWHAYSIMYTLPPIRLEFNAAYAWIASSAAVACTLTATLWACYNELAAVPAELIRPKAPPPGKRVFLERIPALWKRLRFTKKVTARNLFRYKKRFFMTIIGIGGCTALMLTGFGLRDSIAGIVSHQYTDIHTYDAVISVEDPSGSSEDTALNAELPGLVPDNLYVMQAAGSAEHKGKSMDLYLFVPEDPQKLNGFVAFRDRTTAQPVAFPQGDAVVLTEKLANELGLVPGDEFTVKKGDTTAVNATVGGITENYIYNYVYMTPDTYAAAFGEPPEYKEILVRAAQGETFGEVDETALSTRLLTLDNAESVTFTTKISRDFGDVMQSLDAVVWLLIICANLLAFIVLYNLVNINITERIREIATIKVLGFFDREVSSYVFRENVVLTAIGALAGLAGGYFLHQYVVSTAEVDIVMFERTIRFLSYLFAFGLTFAFAGIVNFLMYFKLKKISMVESLKSTE